MRMILRKTLVQLGFEQVLEAGDGVEALKLLGTDFAFAVALVDWNMPNMNGIDLVKELRTHAEWADIKVVMVTTEADLSHVQRALDAGANEYVMKPFTPEMLSEKLMMIGVVQ